MRQRIGYQLASEGLFGKPIDADVVLWSERQAELLRRRAAESANDAARNKDRIAEEIAAVGGSARRDLQTCLVLLLHHLLEWRYRSELRSGIWRTAIRNRRNAIDDLLRESQSLKPEFLQCSQRHISRARLNALDETGCTIPRSQSAYG